MKTSRYLIKQVGACFLNTNNKKTCRIILFTLQERIMLKDTHREKAPSNKTLALTKSMNTDIQVIGTSNQIFIRSSYTETKFSKKLLAKLRSLRQIHFVLPILFVLTLASDTAVLYGNDALSILTKKRCSRFFKKIFVIQKIYCKVKVLKTIKISNDCHMKTYLFLKRRAILRIPSTGFKENLCSLCWL